MARVLIAGCGYLGTALGVRLASVGHSVWGLRRMADDLPGEIRPLSADLSESPGLANLPPALDFIFYTAAPDSSGAEAYREVYAAGLENLLTALASQKQRPKRLFLASSTSVYAQTSGEWVDEGSLTEPDHYAGEIILEAERLIFESACPATAVRLGGIYGPGRGRLINSVRRGEAVCPEGPPRYVNRIHQGDAAGILHHLMDRPSPEAVYIGVDSEPAGEREVLGWLAEELDAPPPRIAPGAGALSRRGWSNKRCSNARIRGSGYEFIYPTFREGYGEILSGGSI
ncbi:SDR family oxidoreductase [Nitrospinota bacterium]